jgi:ABC-type transport system substrate-binding protein
MEIVQGQLAEVGITMNLEKVEESTWWTDIHEATNYVMNSCDNQMFMPDIDDCYSLYRGGQALNFYGLDNAELNAAYDLQRETTDTEERLQACYDVCRIMGDQALNIPLYEWYNAVAAAADLKGVVACQMLSNYDFCDWSW